MSNYILDSGSTVSDEVLELLDKHDLLRVGREEGTVLRDGITISRGRFGWRIYLQVRVGDYPYRIILHKPHGSDEYVVERE